MMHIRWPYVLGVACLLPAGILNVAPAMALDAEYGALLEAETLRARSNAGGRVRTDTATYIATAEFAVGLEFSEHWRSDLVLLAEDVGNTEHSDFLPTPGATAHRPDAPHVEALTISYEAEPFLVSVGRMTLPFGSFETVMLSDPQALEVGETKTDLGAMLVLGWNDLQLIGSVFEGNFRDRAPDEAGYTVGLEWESDADWYAGAAYLSAQGAARDAPGLLDLHAGGRLGDWSFAAEYTGAPTRKQGEKPAAASVDLGYEFSER